jgi:hypothetical protein
MNCASSFMHPAKVRVNRTEFRQNQRELLDKAKGRTVVVITGEPEEEKLVLDMKYFDEIMHRLKASIETLEVAMDKRLLANIMAAANTLDDDMRRGKLHSMDEVFSED